VTSLGAKYSSKVQQLLCAVARWNLSGVGSSPKMLFVRVSRRRQRPSADPGKTSKSGVLEGKVPAGSGFTRAAQTMNPTTGELIGNKQARARGEAGPEVRPGQR